jgi:phage FluMu protein Com
VCLGAAGLITWVTRRDPSGIETIPADEMTWMLCRNRECEHSYQIPLRQYFRDVEANWDGVSFIAPGLKCPKCREMSCYEAVKCAKCGLVFEKGAVPRDFDDRCPKCNYSQNEIDRKRAAGMPIEEGGQ